jgi:hypothetical protein
MDAVLGRPEGKRNSQAGIDCFLCAMCLGAALNWRQPGLNDLHFAEDAMRFEAAPPGTVMMFPENPAGRTMRLVKHASD